MKKEIRKTKNGVGQKGLKKYSSSSFLFFLFSVPYSLFTKPQSFFLIVGFFFGLTFLILTPPFQTPDEVNHFYRAYDIANGNFSPTKKDNRLGGYIPKSLIEAANKNFDIRFEPYLRTSYKNVSEQLRMKLVDATPEFVDYPNTALYSPISYLPQAFFIFVFKSLGFRPVMLLMLTRLMMLCVWLMVVYRTIKLLPVFKWFFTICALLPMSVFINMSVSADVVTNILGLLWIGNVFSFAFSERKMSAKNLSYLLVLALLFASAKYVYTPMVCLIFLIPRERFQTINFLNLKFRRFAFSRFAFCLLPFALCLILSRYASTITISHDNYNPKYVGASEIPNGVDMKAQIAFLKSHPQKLFDAVYDGVAQIYLPLQDSYIGTLGWLDVRIPESLIYLGYLCLFFILLFDNSSARLKIKLWQRVIMLLVGSIVFYLICLSQYLSWVPVGGSHSYGMQGRYFIIVMPLIFLGLIPTYLNQRLLLFFSLSASVLLLASSAKCLYNRYFFIPKKYAEITCDFENSFLDAYSGEVCCKTNHEDVLATRTNKISDNKSRSGKYACKLDTIKSRGVIFRLYNCVAGDTITSEVWTYGTGASLWIALNEYNNFHVSANKFEETDANGWGKLKLTFVIDKKMENLVVKTYVESKETSYFDDFKIIVHSAK